MAGTLWACNQVIDWIALGQQPALRLLYLLGVVLAAAATYFIVLILLGFRVKDFTRPQN